ncbi:MAG TPA: ABC transporter ATP-binding protein [Gemmatimonadales bacterium]|nr:ABC transporter ATP-binding protein [Gemmatimonadales bacterium]
MTTLALDRVTFRYPATAAPALREVSLEVRGGDLLALVGEVGAGASTLLLVAAGLAPRVTGGAVTGTVTRNGAAGIVLATPWTQVSGMAFTVRDEVAFGPANLGRPLPAIREAVDRALARFEITDLAGRDPATLSGGELQRVILAGVLAMEPALLLLDEPTAELDPAGAALAWRIFAELAREGTSVMVASSDLDAAAAAATRVAWLERGALRRVGTPRDVLAGEEIWAGPGSSAVAGVFRRAAMATPFPLTVSEAVARLP